MVMMLYGDGGGVGGIDVAEGVGAGVVDVGVDVVGTVPMLLGALVPVLLMQLVLVCRWYRCWWCRRCWCYCWCFCGRWCSGRYRSRYLCVVRLCWYRCSWCGWGCWWWCWCGGVTCCITCWCLDTWWCWLSCRTASARSKPCSQRGVGTCGTRCLPCGLTRLFSWCSATFGYLTIRTYVALGAASNPPPRKQHSTRYITLVGVGWQLRCRTRQSRRELYHQGTVFVVFGGHRDWRSN